MKYLRKFLMVYWLAVCNFGIVFNAYADGDYLTTSDIEAEVSGDEGGGTSGNTIFDKAIDKVKKVFKHTKTITYILAGFGLVGIAYSAILGKVKWTWFAGLAVGLAILSAAGAIVQYVTGTEEADVIDGLGTTFKADTPNTVTE